MVNCEQAGAYGGAVKERIIRAFLVEEHKIVKKVLKMKKAIGNAGGPEVIDATINEAKPFNYKI